MTYVPKKWLWAGALSVLSMTPGTAQNTPAPAPSIAAFSDAFLLPELFRIMADEGIDYAQTVRVDFGIDVAADNWTQTVSAIYDPALMQEMFVTQFTEQMAGRDDVVADALDFAASDVGTRVLRLEISARDAMLDPDLDEAARDSLEDMRAAEHPRLDLIAERIEVNDLIDLNVAISLNTAFTFFNALGQEDDQGLVAPAQDLLAQLWTQEPMIRADTTEWIYSYFVLAYQPLSDADLQTYIDFSASDNGVALNNAMFAAFEYTFDHLSRALGNAAGTALQSTDL